MKALARLEAILQDIVERPQWLLSPRKVHPLQVAAAITRELESQVIPVGDREVAPDRYTVKLNSEDDEQFSGIHRTLEREFAMYVSRAAEERGLALAAAPQVAIIADERLRAGEIKVEASFADGVPQRPAPARTPVSGFTERIERSQVMALPPPATRSRLELLSDNDGVVRSFPLNGGIVTIGRRSGNDVALLDLEVSRQHARIDFVAPRYYVSDLGSTNGTRLNGQRVTGRQPLKDGDLIELGHQRLRFRSEG